MNIEDTLVEEIKDQEPTRENLNNDALQFPRKNPLANSGTLGFSIASFLGYWGALAIRETGVLEKAFDATEIGAIQNVMQFCQWYLPNIVMGMSAVGALQVADAAIFGEKSIDSMKNFTINTIFKTILAFAVTAGLEYSHQFTNASDIGDVIFPLVAISLTILALNYKDYKRTLARAEFLRLEEQ